LTMWHTSVTPRNHGLVSISADGWVNKGTPDETPVEDFGMYIIQETPFPDNEKDCFNLFMALIAERDGCVHEPL
jgi:hypothetical protein